MDYMYGLHKYYFECGPDPHKSRASTPRSLPLYVLPFAALSRLAFTPAHLRVLSPHPDGQPASQSAINHLEYPPPIINLPSCPRFCLPNQFVNEPAYSSFLSHPPSRLRPLMTHNNFASGSASSRISCSGSFWVWAYFLCFFVTACSTTAYTTACLDTHSRRLRDPTIPRPTTTSRNTRRLSTACFFDTLLSPAYMIRVIFSWAQSFENHRRRSAFHPSVISSNHDSAQ